MVFIATTVARFCWGMQGWPVQWTVGAGKEYAPSTRRLGARRTAPYPASSNPIHSSYARIRSGGWGTAGSLALSPSR